MEIGVRSVFDTPTVERSVAQIEEAMKAGEKLEAPPPGQSRREAEHDCRCRSRSRDCGSLIRLKPGNPVYNIPVSVRLEGGA